jgi:hypothetical protein
MNRDERNAQTVMVGKAEGMRPMETLRHRLSTVLKWIIEAEDRD